jgi:hypothetical protein
MPPVVVAQSAHKRLGVPRPGNSFVIARQATARHPVSARGWPERASAQTVQPIKTVDPHPRWPRTSITWNARPVPPSPTAGPSEHKRCDANDQVQRRPAQRRQHPHGRGPVRCGPRRRPPIGHPGNPARPVSTAPAVWPCQPRRDIRKEVTHGHSPDRATLAKLVEAAPHGAARAIGQGQPGAGQRQGPRPTAAQPLAPTDAMTTIRPANGPHPPHASLPALRRAVGKGATVRA